MIRPDTKDRHYFTLQEPHRTELLQREMDWSDNPIGLVTLYRTYLRQKNDGTLETWNECVLRVIEGMFSFQKTHVVNSGLLWDEGKAQKTALDAADRLFQFKWTPPGRGLWMMGTDFVWERGGAALNNPLSLDTNVLTQEYGWVRLGDIDADEVTVLSSTKLYARDNATSAQATWVKGQLTAVEVHPCKKIVVQDRSGNETSIVGSLNHRWFRRRYKTDWERVTTEDLLVGDYLPSVRPPRNYKISSQGVQHGLFFADGTRSNGELHQFKEGVSLLEAYFTNVEHIDSDHAVVRQCPHAWGRLPEGSYRTDKRYMYGFVAGLVAGDGHVSAQPQVTISSARLDELEEIVTICKELGINCSAPSVSSTTSNLVSDRNPGYVIRLHVDDLDEQFFVKSSHKSNYMASNHGANRSSWRKVVSISDAGEQEVRCLTVPHYEQFVIDGFVLTSNCAFVSTQNIDTEFSEPFRFLMDMSMLGVGCGFDTRGSGKVVVNRPEGEPEVFVVPDTREGWVESIGRLIDSYLIPGSRPVEQDTKLVRRYGEPISGFGGVASGPLPLVQGFLGIKDILEKYVGHALDSVGITDIQNIIGKIVVAGNVRRTAEIAFADPADKAFRTMKDWQLNAVETGAAPPPELKEVSEEDYNIYAANLFNPEGEKIVAKYKNEPWAYKFGGWRWASNNSLFASVGMDYSEIATSIAVNGEPGLAWLENMREYGRMKDGKNSKDKKAMGGNPCLEQTLESYELCTLVETYPSRNANAKDYYETLKIAYLYAKTVTLIATHNAKTNTVMCRNRRIGTSQSGIIDAMAKFGRHYYQKNLADIAYEKIEHFDDVYSDWLGVPRSIKKTSVKPSGSVSLLANVSPGIHYPKVRYGYRTMRIAKGSPLVPILSAANYRIETSVSDPLRAVVVYFPIIGKDDVPCEADASIWEQFTNAVMMQKYWADNQVSITISFKPEQVKDIAKCLSTFDSELKGVSLMPLFDHGYKQAPYITADKEEVVAYKKSLLPLDTSQMHNLEEGDNAESNKFCDGESCTI
jgi:adenosylcobalamin-dependent ribonucleoside-triphosphate reductase